MAYRAKSIAYNAPIAQLTTSPAIYTVPAGVTAKLTYIFSSSTAVYVKLNDSTNTRNGLWPSSSPSGYNALDLTKSLIYLNAGDSVYLYNISNTTDLTEYGFTMCFIEEY